MNVSRHFSDSKPGIAFARCAAGSGSMTLLLHGVTRLLDDWEPVFAGLLAYGDIVACDHRGHGRSERGSSYLVMDYVEDCVGFLRREIGSPVTLVGHSLGAMVAAAVAARVPEYVKALVLEDPPFESMGSRILGSGWQSQFIGMESVARRAGESDDLTGLLAQVSIPQTDGTVRSLGELRSSTSLKWSAHCLRYVDPDVFTPLIEGRWLHGYNRHGVFRSIQCPTLLLQADPSSGGALSDADAFEVASMIEKCTHVRFPGKGHQLHRDYPEAFLSAIDEFTAQNQS